MDEFEKHRSEILMEKFCPTIYGYLKNSKIDWKEIDKNFEENCLIPGIEHETNIFSILLCAESGNEKSKSFLKYCNNLARKLEEYTNEKRKFRNIIIGKFTNFKDLNYLNPIGELSALNSLINHNFELIRIEDQLIFPNSKPKDFLVKAPSGKEYLVEVVNIHLRCHIDNIDELKSFLYPKIKDKINSETNDIDIELAKSKLFFLPVLWNIDFHKFKIFNNFFKEFSKDLGRDIGTQYNILGVCTILTNEENEYIFGEISTFYDRYNID